MRNKIMTALLTAVLLLQGGMTAAAQEYTTEGTAECRISCQVNSTYTVSIPATVGLTYSADAGTATGSFQVGVKSDLLLNQMVQVEPTHLTNEYHIDRDWKAAVEKYLDSRSLTKEMVDAFVDRVVVHGDGSLEIHLAYDDMLHGLQELEAEREAEQDGE